MRQHLMRLALLSLVLAAAACARPDHNALNSTLWVQTSAEYRAVAFETYQTACDKLDAALQDRTRTAAVEQTNDYEPLPPAVILDIDETVLDNSAYQARLILDHTEWNARTWDAWIARAEASAVPGALEFIRAAKERGVSVVYITNRECSERPEDSSPCPQERDTLENLRKLGFPEPGPDDDMLLQNERAEWTSEKQSRRAYAAQTHRILMLLGDDLGDFLPNVKKNVTLEQRARLVGEYRAYWGDRWFMLPNPMYGSWDKMLTGCKARYLRGYDQPE